MQAPLDVIKAEKSKPKWIFTSLSMLLSIMALFLLSLLTVFKEMLQSPETASSASSASTARNRNRKSSDITGLKNNDTLTSTGSKNNRFEDGSSSTSSTLLKPSSTRPLPALSGRDRVKAMMKMLIPKPKVSDNDLNTNQLFNVNSEDGFEAPAECPEHALKIYKSDQHFRYLLVHPETRAQEVVMLALQEFGITELSSNYSLYEVTVKNDNVMQKRQPEGQTNLAERIGLSSRYYIKNIMSSDQLITPEAKNELNKESIVHLLDLNPMETAAQIMVEDFTTFRQIELTEYIDNLFELHTSYGTPNLTKFGELVNQEMMWVITEIVSETNVGKRVRIIKQFIKVKLTIQKPLTKYLSKCSFSFAKLMGFFFILDCSSLL